MLPWDDLEWLPDRDELPSNRPLELEMLDVMDSRDQEMQRDGLMRLMYFAIFQVVQHEIWNRRHDIRHQFRLIDDLLLVGPRVGHSHTSADKQKVVDFLMHAKTIAAAELRLAGRQEFSAMLEKPLFIIAATLALLPIQLEDTMFLLMVMDVGKRRLHIKVSFPANETPPKILEHALQQIEQKGDIDAMECAPQVAKELTMLLGKGPPYHAMRLSIEPPYWYRAHYNSIFFPDRPVEQSRFERTNSTRLRRYQEEQEARETTSQRQAREKTEKEKAERVKTAKEKAEQERAVGKATIHLRTRFRVPSTGLAPGEPRVFMELDEGHEQLPLLDLEGIIAPNVDMLDEVYEEQVERLQRPQPEVPSALLASAVASTTGKPFPMPTTSTTTKTSKNGDAMDKTGHSDSANSDSAHEGAPESVEEDLATQLEMAEHTLELQVFDMEDKLLAAEAELFQRSRE